MKALQTALASRPDLLKPQWRGKVEAGAHPLTGHCYVACEVLWHLNGGQDSGLTPQTIRHEGVVHWFLRHTDSGAVVDPTAEQFATPPPYQRGRGRGFLTRKPSKRARVILEMIGGSACCWRP